MEERFCPAEGGPGAWAPVLLRIIGGEATLSVKERLEKVACFLSLVERVREERGLPGLGANIERIILDRELQDLDL